ncbi:unnamed protein product [Ascophyllum nodosum]
MLLYYRGSCRTRRSSLAAGMALALAGRTAGLVPVIRAPAANTAACRTASRCCSSTCLRTDTLVKATSGATYTGSTPVRLYCRRRGWVTGSASSSSVSFRKFAAAGPFSVGARIMCTSSSSVAESTNHDVDSSSGLGEELSAGDLALSAQIKAKGDDIRDLKDGGASKDDLRPHIEELLELKQLFVKATGDQWGAAADGGKAKKSNKEGRKSGDKQQQPTKQMDTRKADKARKLSASDAAEQARLDGAEQARVEAAARDALQDLPRVLYPSKAQLEAGAEEPAKIGDYILHKSEHETGRVFSRIKDLGVDGGVSVGEQVWVRGRVHQVRGTGGSTFLVLRQDAVSTVQAVHFKDRANPEDSKRREPLPPSPMIKYVASLPLETVVDVKGKLVEANVKSCTQGAVEIQIERVHAVSRAAVLLPFSIEDAARSEEEVEASQETDRPFPRLGQDLRLDNRWLDLRTPANNAIMRLQSGVCQLFREALYSQDFVEIRTPKIIPGESEGGAGVFTTDYFGRQACLAQSPQLYKQMAISADLGRVFEIGPVFRAENSNTRRHLCEFTGLDLEMSITDHYNEVILVLHNTFKTIFSGLEQRFEKELEAVRLQYPSEAVAFTEEPLVVHWEDGIKMLRDAGHKVGDFDDLSGAQELALGGLVKDKFGSDFFFLDRFPSAVRPFYTMPCPDDSRYSNSYDLILRGQEICSGAQRCHDADMLVDVLKEKGVPPEPLADYINAFRHGCPPHGGGGVGLERIVFLYLGLDNVRKASMFPRDPSRCTP